MIKEKYKEWCKITKRNGSVLVGGSIYEFFDWLEEQPVYKLANPLNPSGLSQSFLDTINDIDKKLKRK